MIIEVQEWDLQDRVRLVAMCICGHGRDGHLRGGPPKWGSTECTLCSCDKYQDPPPLVETCECNCGASRTKVTRGIVIQIGPCNHCGLCAFNTSSDRIETTNPLESVGGPRRPSKGHPGTLTILDIPEATTPHRAHQEQP